MNAYFQAAKDYSPPGVLEALYREAYGILDRPAYEVEGQVTTAPEGYAYPNPVYNWQAPYRVMQASDDLRFLFYAAVFLLALAIIFRK